MSKISLTNLVNLQNETTAVNAINANNAVLTAAMDKTLSRDGTIPNTMSAPLDMNSNQILNLPTPVGANSPIRQTDLNALIAAISTVPVAVSGSYLDIRSYGALVGAADNTTAIQNAINAGISLTTPVYIPNGVFKAANLTVTGTVKIFGEGTLKRIDNTVGNNPVLSISNTGSVILDGFTVDGNKAVQTNGAHNIQFQTCFNCTVRNVTSINAKTASGYGSGILFIDCTDAANSTRSNIISCTASNCGESGINITRCASMTVFKCFCNGNTSYGIISTDTASTPVLGICKDSIFIENTCNNNNVGIGVGGYVISGQNTSSPVYGPDSCPSTNCIISNNEACNNLNYGFAVPVRYSTVCNNVSKNNTSAGFNFPASYSILNNNACYNEGVYGIDAGGGSFNVISNNDIADIGLTSGVTGIGINIGANLYTRVSDNVIRFATAGSGITAPGIDGDGTTPFPLTGRNCTIENNLIFFAGVSGLAVFVYRNFDGAVVQNNICYGTTSINPYTFMTPVVQSGNRVSLAGSCVIGVNAATTLVLPDGGDDFLVSGSTGIANITTSSQTVYAGKVRDVVMSSQGSGYSKSNKPTVVWTVNVGGTAPVSTLEIDNGGRIIGMTFSNAGLNITSASFTLNQSGGQPGSGAAGTAVIGLAPGERHIIRMMFANSLTMTSGTNLLIAGGTLSATGTTVLSLISAYGALYELSRNGL